MGLILYVGVGPQAQLGFLHQLHPEIPILPRDLYNQNARIRREPRQGQSSIKALLKHLEASELPHRLLVGPENRVQHLFISLPECIKHLQSNYDVVLIDNTYKANRFNLPLFDVIGEFILVVGTFL